MIKVVQVLILLGVFVGVGFLCYSLVTDIIKNAKNKKKVEKKESEVKDNGK